MARTENGSITDIACEHAPVAIIALSEDAKVLFWNSEAGRIFGYTSEQAIGKSLSELFQPLGLAEIAQEAARRSAESGESWRATLKLRRKDRQADLALAVDRITNHGETPQIITMTALDMTGLRRIPEPPGLAALTPRQQDVLRLLVAGVPTREIAQRLGLSVKTVETHRAHMMRRLGIFDVPGLVRFAIRAGVTTAEL